MCILRTIVFFFNDTATTEIYTLSLHDALPISKSRLNFLELLRAGHTDYVINAEALAYMRQRGLPETLVTGLAENPCRDRKSTRLNSSHANISYAVFCLKKKKRRISYTCRTTTI